MNFAEKLQKLRKERGMSQENFADVIGVSRQAVSKWESGQSYPEIDKLVLISNLFNVSIDSLIKDDNEFTKEDYVQNNTSNNFSDLKHILHFEYKSNRNLFNIPLVHINLGFGFYVAKGIIAIGNIAVGLLSIGILALGLLCFGSLALGLVSIAGIALGLLLSTGGVAIGTIAIGGAAIGIFAIGGLAVGKFSLGGCAVASNIAIGGYAHGHIAIGDTVSGAKTILAHKHNLNGIKAEQVRNLINQEYPHLWQPIVNIITSIFS